MDCLVYILQFVRPNDVRNLLRVNKSFNQQIENNFWPLCCLLGYQRIPLYIGSIDEPREYQYDRDKYLYFIRTNRLNLQYSCDQVGGHQINNNMYYGLWRMVGYEKFNLDQLNVKVSLRTVASDTIIPTRDKTTYSYIIDSLAQGYSETYIGRSIIRGTLQDGELQGVIEYIDQGYISEFTYDQGFIQGPSKQVKTTRIGRVFVRRTNYVQHKEQGTATVHFEDGEVRTELYDQAVLQSRQLNSPSGEVKVETYLNGVLRSQQITRPDGDIIRCFYDDQAKILAYAEWYIRQLKFTFRGDWTFQDHPNGMIYLVLDSKNLLYPKWRQYILSRPEYEPMYYLLISGSCTCNWAEFK